MAAQGDEVLPQRYQEVFARSKLQIGWSASSCVQPRGAKECEDHWQNSR